MHKPGLSNSYIIALTSRMGAGKSTLSRALAERLGLPRISFGDYVREVARDRHIADSRRELQELGESLVEASPKGFACAVLEKVNWRSGAVIDGVRHIVILEALQELVAPLPVFLIYVAVEEPVRLKRLAERGMSPAEIEAADAHPTEEQVKEVLREKTALQVSGRDEADRVAESVALWLQLLELSGRIASLMQGVPKLRDTLDYMTGAVYGLLTARELGFDDRDFPLPEEYWKAPLKRAQDMSRGAVRKDGKWAAGFFFNSALLRVAADYHRVLKLLTGRDDYVPALIKLIAPPFEHQNLDVVHREVNDLKHSPTGLADGRKIAFANAVAAVKELVDLIEAKRQQFA